MATGYHSRKSLNDFNDRELLFFILSNQINLFRQTKYLMNAIKNKEDVGVGLFEETFHEMIQDVDEILEQVEDYMNKSNEDKGFISF